MKAGGCRGVRTYHQPAGHTDNVAARYVIAIELCAALWDDTWKSAYNTERQTKAFFDYCCLEALSALGLKHMRTTGVG